MRTLIIGATGGIGAATARAFAQAGAALVLAGRNEAKVQALGAELDAPTHTLDLSYESHVQRLFQELEGPLATVVYAAGAAFPQALKDADAANVRAVWNANYFGALWVLKHGLSRVSPLGRVYLLGARPELVTFPRFSQYAASKAALHRAAEIARQEARSVGITLVLPGAVNTELWAQAGRVPQGALSPDVVARAIVLDRAGMSQPELIVND